MKVVGIVAGACSGLVRRVHMTTNVRPAGKRWAWRIARHTVGSWDNRPVRSPPHVGVGDAPVAGWGLLLPHRFWWWGVVFDSWIVVASI